MREYTITFGHNSGDPEGLWDREKGDYSVPDERIDYAKSMIRNYFPDGGSITTVEGWWRQAPETATVATMIGRADVDVFTLAGRIARRLQQDAVLVRITEQDGSWKAYLVKNEANIEELS